jgi:hypothetical protein
MVAIYDGASYKTVSKFCIAVAFITVPTNKLS